MDNETKIIEIINTETEAFDTKNIELLLSIFHPDMVWPWPPKWRCAQSFRMGNALGSI